MKEFNATYGQVAFFEKPCFLPGFRMDEKLFENTIHFKFR
jgi:hypothetical protein